MAMRRDLPAYLLDNKLCNIF